MTTTTKQSTKNSRPQTGNLYKVYQLLKKRKTRGVTYRELMVDYCINCPYYVVKQLRDDFGVVIFTKKRHSVNKLGERKKYKVLYLGGEND